MDFWVGLGVGFVIGVLTPFGLPKLIDWAKTLRDGEKSEV